MLRSAAAHATVVDCSNGLPVVDANPHLWLDPEYARRYVVAMRDGMIAADPAGAATYRANAAALDGAAGRALGPHPHAARDDPAGESRT